MIIWWSAAAVCVGKLEVCHYCVGGEMDGWHDVEDMVLLWMGVQLNGGLLGGKWMEDTIPF